MRAVVQRVSQARVVVDDAVTGSIDTGLMVLLGVGQADTEKDADYLADKIAGLRIFPDEAGKMNRSVADCGGAMLVVSQFTLYGDCRKGRRPGFDQAADSQHANRLYEYFVVQARARGLHVETGVFQTKMAVHMVNDGPVTLILDSSRIL
ncbi:MAG: D-aminoacyl-tRNA deacylase [Acidobacteria bacterium]|nr:D-aminoacyl-tRNA deacylase [Acidobacteriota bacterium]